MNEEKNEDRRKILYDKLVDTIMEEQSIRPVGSAIVILDTLNVIVAGTIAQQTIPEDPLEKFVSALILRVSHLKKDMPEKYLKQGK